MNTSGPVDQGLRLFPFRGLRYVPERVGSLAAVTSPPYDVVVRPDGLHHLESADPHNIVRLILPQADTARDRHRQAAATLDRWLAEGVIAPDPDPVLYVYEQRNDEILQRGLIGTLALSPAAEGIVLPHEDVMDDVVADRAELMRTTGAHLEPLLLTYRGGTGAPAGAAAVIERTVLREPLLATTTEDGFRHRLWAVTDPSERSEIASDLARHQALIADGHHRWATYLRLQREQTAPGPWDHGLVLLVDTARHPLQVRAIHRLLRGLPVSRALEALTGLFRVRPVEGPLPGPSTRWPKRRPGATLSSSPATAASIWWTVPTRPCWLAPSGRTAPTPGAPWTRRSCTPRCSTTCGGSPTHPSTSATSTTPRQPSNRRNVSTPRRS